jgi:O-antigen/teichoic acid export membrane protein
VEVAAAAFGTFASIALALLDYGIYALIFGQVLGGALDSVLLAIIGWRRWAPQFHYRLKDLKSFAGFGAFQMGERCANIFAANIDYMLIGRMLGPVVLGSYTIAYQLIIAPVTRINPILTRVAFPIFAKKQNDDSALRLGYLEISKFLALVVSPLLAGVAAGAPVLVPVLLGSRWNDAIVLVQILAPMGLLKTFANPIGSILMAKGRADIGFWINVYVAVEYLVVFPFVVKSGPASLAVAYLIMVGINFVFGQFLINYLIAMRWRDYLGAIMSSVISAVLMAVIVALSWHFIASKFGVSVLSAGIVVSIGATVYAFCVLALERPYIVRTIKLVRTGQ